MFIGIVLLRRVLHAVRKRGISIQMLDTLRDVSVDEVVLLFEPVERDFLVDECRLGRKAMVELLVQRSPV